MDSYITSNNVKIITVTHISFCLFGKVPSDQQDGTGVGSRYVLPGGSHWGPDQRGQAERSSRTSPLRNDCIRIA